MEKFKKLMEAKMKDKKPAMSDTEKEAKMSVLEHVRGMAQDMMKDRLSGGMKKVEVASDSKKGLAEGLAKAKEMMEGHSDDESEASDEESQEDPAEEASEESSESDPEMGEMSEEELDAKLQQLMAMKKMMGSKKV